jgi:hypothetical protein
VARYSADGPPYAIDIPAVGAASSRVQFAPPSTVRKRRPPDTGTAQSVVGVVASIARSKTSTARLVGWKVAPPSVLFCSPQHVGT